jgi:hypothetical protein
MTFGINLPILITGRVLVGMACGIATVLVPLYLSEVSPPAVRGRMYVILFYNAEMMTWGTDHKFVQRHPYAAIDLWRNPARAGNLKCVLSMPP